MNLELERGLRDEKRAPNGVKTMSIYENSNM